MTKNEPDILVHKKLLKLKTEKLTKVACDLKSSNNNSLSLWLFLVVYLLYIRIILINKTINILNKFTIPSLVCIR